MTSLLSNTELKQASRILFMTHLAIGDFVYHGPMLHALCQQYPNLELDVWIDDCRDRKKSWHKGRNEALQRWLKASNLATVIFPIAASEGEREKLIRQASRRGYDIIVYMATSRIGKFADVARKISATAIVVGNTPEKILDRIRHLKSLQAVNRKFVIEQVPQQGVNTSHIFERYQRRYNRCFGELRVAEKNQHGLYIDIPPRSQDEVKQWLQDNASAHAHPLVVVNPISTSKKRDMEPSALVQTLLAVLSAYENAHIVVNVPPSSVLGVKALLVANPKLDKQRLSIFSATEDFFMLPALLSRASFIVTVETAVMHLASTMNKPQLAIIREQAATWRPLRSSDIYWCKGQIDSVQGNQLAPRVLSAMNRLFTP